MSSDFTIKGALQSVILKNLLLLPTLCICECGCYGESDWSVPEILNKCFRP